MRIVIVGQQWLGDAVLKLCLQRGDDVAKVIAPEEHDRLYDAARQSGVPVEISGRRIEASHIPAGVDVIVAAHAHAFITEAARLATKYGALGYHPSLLPRHRGRDAVHWTIHMGDSIAGGTVYWMDDGADTGPIAAQNWCHVLHGDDARTLWRRELAPMGVQLIEKVLGDLDNGVVTAIPQPCESATWEPSFSSPRLAEK
jgi:methionyl-tRNA formyltransferase